MTDEEYPYQNQLLSLHQLGLVHPAFKANLNTIDSRPVDAPTEFTSG